MKDAGYLIARGTVDGPIDLSNPALDYYALNSDPIGITTNLPYFESTLYNVQGSNIAILLYHRIDNTDTADETVTIDNFAAQMAYLAGNGYTVKTLSDVFFDVTPLSTPTPTPSPSPTPRLRLRRLQVLHRPQHPHQRQLLHQHQPLLRHQPQAQHPLQQ